MTDPRKEPDPRLVDAQRMGRKHKDTFQVPPDYRLNLLGEGDLVKVCLEDEDSGERFWLEVVGPPVNGVYHGKIVNDVDWGLGRGAALYFERRHVYDTLLKGERP